MNAHAEKISCVLDKNTSAHRAHDVFRDWLDLVDGTLRMIPWHFISVMEHGRLADDHDDVKATWDRLRPRYSPSEFQRFAEAFGLLLDSTVDGEDIVYRDTLGDVYMTFGNPNPRSGQFFTPFPIAKMMAEMQGGDTIEAEIARRRAAGDYTPFTVNDPACGSGVMFLAMASCLSRETVTRGHIMFYGTDIDPTCISMARSNVRLYGLNATGVPVFMQRRIKRTPVPRREPVPIES